MPQGCRSVKILVLLPPFCVCGCVLDWALWKYSGKNGVSAIRIERRQKIDMSKKSRKGKGWLENGGPE